MSVSFSSSKQHLQLTFLAVFPIIPQWAVTLVTIPLWSAGSSIRTRTLHTRMRWICHIDSTCGTNCNRDGAIIEYQLGRWNERRWRLGRRLVKICDHFIWASCVSLKLIGFTNTFWIIPVKGFSTPAVLLVWSYFGTPPMYRGELHLIWVKAPWGEKKPTFDKQKFGIDEKIKK